MNKTVTLRNNRSVTVIFSNKPNDGISESDAEMDIRAREAVRSAINKAVICKSRSQSITKLIKEHI
ncbi:MAG: hypothetical protein ACI4JK_12715 [Oscillospiraceae bacterium]